MWLFVGLGNPGSKYQHHRHNVGFMAADSIVAANSFPAYRTKFHGKFTQGHLGATKLSILKPDTYMNNSGQSVAAAAQFYKIPVDKLVIFHDELDLPPGRVKIKKGGGLAGHNGLKSIKAHMGADDFYRVRIGIGHPGDKNQVSGYVLHDFSTQDQQWLTEVLSVIGSYPDLLLQDDQAAFMNKLGQ